MKTSWLSIFLLYAIGVLAAGQLGIVPPLVPVLRRDLGLSLAGAGLAVSIVTLVGAALGLLAGQWCEVVGHRRALGGGLLIMAAAAALCATADDGTMLLVARGVAGVGYLLVVVAGPSLMAITAEPRHHAFALSLWGTFVPVGITLAGLTAAGFVDRSWWRTLFAGDALLLAAAMFVAIVALPRGQSTARRAERRLPLQQLGASLPLATAFFCFALLFLAVAGLLPTYLVDQRGLAADDTARVVAVATALGVIGSLAAAWLLRRGVPPGRLIALGLVASTAMAALAFGFLAAPLEIAAAAWSFAVGGLVPAATFASVPLVARDQQEIGPINGLLAQAGSLGSLVGPPLLALWVEGLGWPTAPAMLIAVATIGAAAALRVKPIARPASRRS